MTPKAATGATKRVTDLMSSPVLTTTPRTKATDAALVIGPRNITALPLLDEARLVGQFTMADLLRCRPSTGQSDLLVSDDDPRLTRCRTRQRPRRTGPHRATDTRTVPVIENGRLVGIITTHDLRVRARSAHAQPARGSG